MVSRVLLIIDLILFCTLVFAYFISIINFGQIGPTCGYYAFIQGLYKAGYISKQNRVQYIYDILKEDFANDKSIVGEIFDIKRFIEIFNYDVFNEFENKTIVELLPIDDETDYDVLLNESVIIYPVLNQGKTGSTPHYYLVEKIKGEIVYHKILFSVNRKCDLNRFYRSNQKLVDFSYDWNQYFPLKFRSYFFGIFQAVFAPKRYAQIHHREKIYNKKLKNKSTKVNMANYIICIHNKD